MFESVRGYSRKKAVMDWLNQSPDVNFTEAVWDHLYRERNQMQPTSKEDLLEGAYETPGEVETM